MMKEIPFLLFVALAQARRIEIDKWQNLGQTLGYRPMAIWFYVIWPQIYKTMRLPIFAVLAYALSVVDMTLILGPTLPPTLPVVILQGFEDPDLGARLPASAGALLQIALVLSALPPLACRRKRNGNGQPVDAPIWPKIRWALCYMHCAFLPYRSGVWGCGDGAMCNIIVGICEKMAFFCQIPISL